MGTLFTADVIQGKEPQHAHAYNRRAQCQDERYELGVAHRTLFPHVAHRVRKLHAEQDEDDSIENERQNLPDACRDDFHAGNVRADASIEKRIGKTRRHDGQNPRNVHLFGDKEHEKRRQHLKQDVKRRVLEPEIANAGDEESKNGRAYEAEADPSEKAHDKRRRGVEKRKGARSKRGDGELERHDA